MTLLSPLALMSKENRTQTLIKVGAEEASTCFSAQTSQDEASYNGDVSNADEEYIEVVPDEVDDNRSKVRSQLKLTQSQTRKFQKLPTRRTVAKPQSLQTRNQFTNAATGLHLNLKMAQSAMIGTSLLMVKRTSIPRTISPFTAFRGQAECFL